MADSAGTRPPGASPVALQDLALQAVAAHGAGELQRAEQLYRQRLALGPFDAQVAGNLGALLRAGGRLAEAEAHYRWALGQGQADPLLLANACNLLRERGQAEETLGLLQQGLQLHPSHVALRTGLALSLHHAGRVEEALALLGPLRQEQPEAVNLWLETGACLAKRGALPQALAAFERVCVLAPEQPAGWGNRLTVLTDLGQLDQAEALLAALPPELAGHLNLLSCRAALLLARNQMQEAAALLERLIGLEPERPEHWLNLAAAQRALKQMVAPLATLEQALARHPQHADLRHALGTLLIEHCRYREALPLLEEALDRPDGKDGQLSSYQFAMAAARVVPAEQLRQRAQAWEQRRALKPRPLWRDRLRDPDPERALKVAYLSPDFCNHPVGRFIEPVLERHDRRQVEVIGLSCGRHHDGVTERLRAHCDQWHDLRWGDDLACARAIADLQVDVLVDLAGYSSDQRLRLLTAQPAPLQLSYLGYPASTYLQYVQGWIGDPVLFGSQQEQEKGEAELLLKLQRCYLAFRPRAAPEPQRTAGDGRFRFGSFNHSRKLSDPCLDRFAAVLRAVPGSLLVLKSISFVEQAEQQRIAARLQQRGIGPERLELLAWVADGEDHMGLYGQIDVALDTTPYSGTTTTAEALWMGVPVLAVWGQVAVERQAAAVLVGAGLEAAVAADEADLVRRAQMAAAAGPRSADQRLALRRHVARSMLCDEQGLVAALEGLYRRLWQALPAMARR